MHEKSVVSFTHELNVLHLIERHCAREDHHLLAVICTLRGKLSANEKEEKFTWNDNLFS